MGDRSYEYIMAINKFGVLSVAAKELGVSQSTLTKFLQKEQKRLKIDLFQKIDGKFVPTYAGQLYISGIEKINKIEENFENAIRDVRTDKRGIIKIGVCNSRIEFLTSNVMPEFKKYFPDIDVVIYELNFEKIEDMLKNLQIDIGILNVFEKKNEFIYHNVANEKYLLAANENNDIFSCARSAFGNSYIMRVDALNGRDFVVLPKNTIIRQRMDDILFSNKIKFKITSYAASVSTALECVRANLGISFLPRTNTVRHFSRAIKYIEIENISNSYQLALLTRKGTHTSKIVKNFIDIFTRQYNLL